MLVRDDETLHCVGKAGPQVATLLSLGESAKQVHSRPKWRRSLGDTDVATTLLKITLLVLNGQGLIKLRPAGDENGVVGVQCGC